MKYSVIDISSSSLSLIVAEADERKTEIIFKDRVSLSLLHYLEGKRLSERGTEKLIDALKEMKDKCERFGVRYCYLISTAALRVIENCEEVARAVTERTGLPVNFTDGKTEAYCDYIANLYYASFEKAVLLDLGGKSLEICDLTKGNKEDMMCFDFGLLDLHRKFIKKIQPNEKEAKDIKKFLTEKFDDADLPKKEVFATAVMVGATNRAVYDVYADYADVSGEDGVKTIEYKKFKKLVSHLLVDAERSTLILNNAPEKLYLIGPATIVLKNLFKRFGLRHIVVSDRGVKEGYLQLVLEGKESGMYYDFENHTVGGTARALPAAGSKKAVRKGRVKNAPAKAKDIADKGVPARGAEKNGEEAVNGTEEIAATDGKKADEKAGAPAEGQADGGSAAVAVPVKRRGRPRKQTVAENILPQAEEKKE